MSQRVGSVPVAVPEAKRKPYYVPWHEYGKVMSADAECRAVPPLRPVRQQDVEVLFKYRHCYRHDVQSEPSPRSALTYIVPNVAAGKVQERQGGGETARQQPPQQHRNVVVAEGGEEEEEVREAKTRRGLLRRLLACCLCIRLPRGRRSRRTSRVHPEEAPTPDTLGKEVSLANQFPETYTKEKQELVSAWVLRHFGSARDRCRWVEGLDEDAVSAVAAEVMRAHAECRAIPPTWPALERYVEVLLMYRMTGMKVEGREGTENPMNTDDNVVTNSYKLLDEVAVSLEQKCILHICGQRSGKSVALGLSDYSLALYDVCNLHRVCSFPAHTSTITDVKFSSKNEHLLYSSSLDGTVKVHDLRSKTCVAELKDDSEGPSMLKPISSFDFSSDENFGSAGTELFDGDAFVLFWDIRTSKLLGGYWESHTDDITQVRFHPEEKNKLATGSVDGIINVFDISKQCEDDALEYCLNTESSIDKLHWFRGMDSTFNISCITHTEELQLWEIDGASPFAHFTREDIAGILKDDTVDNTYLVNSHNQEDGGLLIIAGYSSLKRQDLSAFSLKKPDMTSVYSVSSMNGNKQEVRGSWYNAKDQVLLTGGEGGFLSLWTRDDESNTGHQTKHFKMKHKSKSKPYQRE